MHEGVGRGNPIDKRSGDRKCQEETGEDLSHGPLEMIHWAEPD